VTTNANATANATANSSTSAESNSSTSANTSTSAKVSANATANTTSVAQKATVAAETSDDWDTDIVQTKETKTATPVPVAQQSEFNGPTDIDDLTLKTQLKSNETIIVSN
jgi:hypothetical protein